LGWFGFTIPVTSYGPRDMMKFREWPSKIARTVDFAVDSAGLP
jgi:hypothetical protein